MPDPAISISHPINNDQDFLSSPNVNLPARSATSTRKTFAKASQIPGRLVDRDVILMPYSDPRGRHDTCRAGKAVGDKRWTSNIGSGGAS